MAAMPSIFDFATQALNPAHYTRLGDDWAIAVADVIGSTQLVAQGRDREINFVAGAVVAVMAETMGTPQMPSACQFGGDGAIAAIPPGRHDHACRLLSALAHWSQEQFDIPLRVGLVPVGELSAAGHHVLAALHDFGQGNVFGQFLGSGAGMAEHWVKADSRWRLDPEPGDLPGLDALSCRWRPIPASRGTVLCLIIDPLNHADLNHIQRQIEAIVATDVAAPLGDGERSQLKVPTWRQLRIELSTIPLAARPLRLARALMGFALMKLADILPDKRLGSFDLAAYKRAQAERSDYRKMAGGPRMVLDVTLNEAQRIEALLTDLEAQGQILFGLSTADATVMTCLVGDFAADRHVHFVDGAHLGYWRAATVLKAKLKH